MTFIVHINDHEHRLADTAIADLKARIIAAVRAGGQFVDLTGAHPGTDVVLVTPATSIRFERAPEPITAEDLGDEDDIAYLDLDT